MMTGHISADRPAVPPGLAVVLARTIPRDRWAVDCVRCTGNAIRVTDDLDNEGGAYAAAWEHYTFRHRSADEMLTVEEIERVQASAFSAAQRVVLGWAERGDLVEFHDGFFGMDVSPNRFDVNKKVAKARVIALWAAGYLTVHLAAPGRRVFDLSDKGRAELALWRLAERQGLVAPAKTDNTFGVTARDRRRYPAMNEGRVFKGEPSPIPDAVDHDAPGQLALFGARGVV